MPSRLRPTTSVAADAILVGDPGRALLLAQELLEQPKMSNHARGLWGYWGHTPDGHELTIQSTGMGGPSAALVLTDLAKLGVRRAVRVGTCAAVDPLYGPGALLGVAEARANGNGTVLPDPELSERLREALAGESEWVAIASLDAPPEDRQALRAGGVVASDLQTATLTERARSLGIAAAAILIVAESCDGERIEDGQLEEAVKRVGNAASTVLSP